MKKMEMFSLKAPFRLRVFCDIFSACLSTLFNSDIRKENRRSHVKLFTLFLKKKNEMK